MKTGKLDGPLTKIGKRMLISKTIQAVALLIFVGLLVTTAGCSRHGYNKNHFYTYQTLHEAKYTVAVRVNNTRNNPLEGVSAVLVKRFQAHDGYPELPVIAPNEQLVAYSDKSGEMLFQFELLRADDVWLYLNPGADSGYVPRYVRLNEYMGDSIFQTEGNTNFSLMVVLERKTAK